MDAAAPVERDAEQPNDSSTGPLDAEAGHEDAADAELLDAELLDADQRDADAPDGGVSPVDPVEVDGVVLGGDVVYLLDAAHQVVIRWSLTTRALLSPLPLAAGPRFIAYSSDDQLYVAYASGQIDRLDPVTGIASHFASTPLPPHGLATAGNYVFAADPSPVRNTQYIFDPDGTLVFEDDFENVSFEYAWCAASQRLYYFIDELVPNDLHWIEIDPASGEIVDEGETTYHGNFELEHPIRPSPDCSHVLVGSGDVYGAPDLDRTSSTWLTFVDAAWTQGGLVAIREVAGSTRIEELDATLQEVTNVAQVEGDPLRVFVVDDLAIVITARAGAPAFYVHELGRDADADGFGYDDDAFPFHPEAALDSDGDGYPDAWNDGYDQSADDALALDAFPFDSACERAEDGLDEDAGQTVCDLQRTQQEWPSYVVDVDIDVRGIVYLIGEGLPWLRRWDSTAQRYLNPIVLRDVPLHVTYSPTTDRLYLAYAGGRISQITLAPTPFEHGFATSPKSIPHALDAAGPWLIARGYYDGGAQDSCYMFSASTAELIYADEYNSCEAIAWDPSTQRLHRTYGWTTLSWDELDPITGEALGQTTTPLTLPGYEGFVRLSADGSRLALANGDIVDADTLELEVTLPLSRPISFRDVAWLGDGSLVAISHEGIGTVLRRFDPSLQLVDEAAALPGAPIRVFARESSLIVVRSPSDPVFDVIPLPAASD